ncbi:DUF4240 domain-containing protein [Saccharothrix sp. NPDC042600]|uniref:DUF4240 domain-containing protein n=1 Tax=Saccharothrix TaxID=2071 RepID=UPI0033D5D8A8|nr:hypothetical protein GCM10017745_65930 [Saccharothrix mutabilis subsp. capreolus]
MITAEEEARFWALLEQAWAGAGAEAARARRALVRRDPEEDDGFDQAAVLEEQVEGVLDRLTELCADMTSGELTALDRVGERKLYDIDREDVHEHTDGSDDGFLYARGFIVVLGREFYEAVARDPRLAVDDASAEDFCYFFAHLHEERFGEFPETGSGISRESGANQAGWAGAGVPSEV